MDEETHRENSIEKSVHNLHALHVRDQKVIRALLACVAVIALAGVGSYFLFAGEITGLKTVQEGQFKQHQATNQFLLSTIDWSAMRTKITLYMRDMVVEEWVRIKYPVDLDEAYRIAEAIVKECENFPYIDPFIVLAMQNAESSFRKDAVSPMGALGLNQIMPSTGRLLCGFFGWTYSDSLLFGIETSTHLAVKYLDVCWAQYGKWDVTLADYNGGSYQAYYYKTDKTKLSVETGAYVPSVTKKMKAYKEGFKTYQIDSKLTSYNITDTLSGSKNADSLRRH
jgi:hypothetical protein